MDMAAEVEWLPEKEDDAELKEISGEDDVEMGQDDAFSYEKPKKVGPTEYQNAYFQNETKRE